jgi:hypothetical protein
MNSVAFGSLTARAAKNYQFLNFDYNKDGIIDLEEFLKAVEEMECDSLAISVMDKDKDQKITKEEFDLWSQEEEINKLCDEAKTKAARDFIGQDNDDIVKFIAALEEFKTEFYDEQKEKCTDVSKLAAEFSKQLPFKYVEIKDNILKNTKSAIKTRVIENVITKIDEQSMKTNSGFFGQKNNILSDNAKRLLGYILQGEADKYAKKYDGDDFEADLNNYLVSFLNKSDKEKLSKAISIWDKDLENISKLSPEVALKNMKDKARNLLLSILAEGVTPTMGSVTIRTEVGITPALAQYKDVDTLLYAIKRVIKNISGISKLEQIMREADGKDDNVTQDFTLEFLQEAEKKQNIFEVTQAA